MGRMGRMRHDAVVLAANEHPLAPVVTRGGGLLVADRHPSPGVGSRVRNVPASRFPARCPS